MEISTAKAIIEKSTYGKGYFRQDGSEIQTMKEFCGVCEKATTFRLINEDKKDECFICCECGEEPVEEELIYE